MNELGIGSYREMLKKPCGFGSTIDRILERQDPGRFGENLPFNLFSKLVREIISFNFIDLEIVLQKMEEILNIQGDLDMQRFVYLAKLRLALIDATVKLTRQDLQRFENGDILVKHAENTIGFLNKDLFPDVSRHDARVLYISYPELVGIRTLMGEMARHSDARDLASRLPQLPRMIRRAQPSPILGTSSLLSPETRTPTGGLKET